MKKLLTVFALTSFTAVFSQITITSNLPSTINAGASIDAEVKINKGTVGNFAKYQMDVPTGYAVTAVEVKNGNFTFENQRAKIVWVSVPSDPEFTVKFKIQANSDAANPGTFSQKFYYLENNEKKEVDGGVNVVTIGGGAVAVNTPTETKPVETKVVETVVTETKPVETKVVETVVTETKPVETVVTETKPVETKKVETVTSTKTTNTTTTSTARVNSGASEAGMTFRVQLGAFTTEPSKNKFASAGSVKIDLIDGMYKVTTGNFTSKEEAIKFRDQLQAKGFSGFIAKYKDGKRVN
jgi:hypothetical protein